MSQASESQEFVWWKHGIVYQIYPRSFADTNGDGVGDLRGIIERLDHLNDGTPQSLGVDAIWLSPIYPSPQHDFGYDVSDYNDVDPRFGTLDDFDELVEKAHARGLRIVMDMVLNHSSHLHPWFVESRSSRQNPRRDWYIWRDGRAPGRPPNNWQSVFGGSAWKWDPRTEQYYLHSFLEEQPDFNWRNPEVKEALFDVLRFWLDRGVDGFRLDVVNYYFKDAQFQDNPSRLAVTYGYGRQRHVYDKDQPEMHPLLKEMRGLLDEYPQRMAVGEVGSDDPAPRAASYLGEEADGLPLAFNFAFARSPWSAPAFQREVERWESLLPPGGWPTYFLSNHDVVRHASRYGAGHWTDARARVAAALLLTLRGTPFLYYGEEIGMRQVRIPKEEIQDPPGRRFWPLYRGRDGCRTPMQWDGTAHAGFTTGIPWLRLGPDYQGRNVAAQRDDPGSLFTFYRRLIWLRKETPALLHGAYRPLQERPARGCLPATSRAAGPGVGLPARDARPDGAGAPELQRPLGPAGHGRTPAGQGLEGSPQHRRLAGAGAPGRPCHSAALRRLHPGGGVSLGTRG